MLDSMDNEYMDEPRSEIDWRVVHTMQLGFSGLIVFVMVVIWAVTGFGDYFWPIWVWFGLAIPLAVQYAIRRASARAAAVAGAEHPRRAVVRRRRHPDLHLGADRASASGSSGRCSACRSRSACTR